MYGGRIKKKHGNHLSANGSITPIETYREVLMQRKKTCAIETAVAMSNLIHFVHKALDVTHPLKILVCNEGKSELGATPDDTSRTTFPKSLEALLSPWSDT